jgi:hypothetical protein
MKILLSSLLILVYFTSSAFCQPLTWGINIGKNYSNRFTSITGDTKDLVSRTSVGVNYLYPLSKNYSIGVEIFTAVDDDVVGSVSTPTYGDILSGISIIHEFQTRIGDIDVGTGLYSLYYVRRNPGSPSETNPLRSFSWGDMSLGVGFKLSSNLELKIKVEPLFSYLLVYQKSLPFSVTLGARF